MEKNKRAGSAVCVTAVLMVLVMLVSVILPFSSAVRADTVEQAGVSRLINVVYDDSNSMIAYDAPGGKEVGWDAWCQAKYSLEVFAYRSN